MKWNKIFVVLVLIILVSSAIYAGPRKSRRSIRKIKMASLLRSIRKVRKSSVAAPPISRTLLPPISRTFWSDNGNSKFDGQPVPVGTVITAFDPDRILCGQTTVTTTGRFSFDCSGDDPDTPQDEGGEPGDIITFYMNGFLATVISGSAVWDSGYQEVNIEAETGCQNDADCNDGFSCTLDTCNTQTGDCSNAADDNNCREGELCNPFFFAPPTGCGSGTLNIEMQVMVGGRLNINGPAPKSLGVVSIGFTGSKVAETAVKVGNNWLNFKDSDGRTDIYADGSDPEWHTQAHWADKRLRGLTPDTSYTFYAKARDSSRVHETELVEVGTYSTNKDSDPNRIGRATALDYAYIRSDIIKGGSIGISQHWPCDVNDDGFVNFVDLTQTEYKILGRAMP